MTDKPTPLNTVTRSIESQIAEHDEILNGSPTARNTGLTQRFDRLEQTVNDVDLIDLDKRFDRLEQTVTGSDVRETRERVILLEDNAIQNGPTELALIRQQLAVIRWVGTIIAGGIITALTSAILSGILTK